MNPETPFLEAIAANPSDATTLLVYADWLEERGDPRAEYVRLTLDPGDQQARLDAMRSRFEPAWVAVIDAYQDRKFEARAELERIDREWWIQQETLKFFVPAPGGELRGVLPSGWSVLKGVVCGMLLLGLGWAILVSSSQSVGALIGIGFVILGLMIVIISMSAHMRYCAAWQAYQQRRLGALAKQARLQPLDASLKVAIGDCPEPEEEAQRPDEPAVLRRVLILLAMAGMLLWLLWSAAK